MQGEPNTFWGKLTRTIDGGPVDEWHPLFDHSADVAAVVEVLLGLPVWRQRLVRLAGQEINETDWARLCVLAALHDIGKLNIGFQAKGRRDLGPTAGHVTEALGALFTPVFSCLHQELPSWGDGVTGLLAASICHHGRPYNCDVMAATAWQASWWTPRAGLDPQAGAAELLGLCRAWFPRAFDGEQSRLPEGAAFSHAFAGLVMLADWMGSDTKFFPFSKPNNPDRMNFARSRAREVVAAMALDVPLSARSDANGRPPFARIARAGYSPTSVQTALAGLPLDADGSITVLEAETGSGKTEAILARFIRLFEAGLVDGMYFALPTRSAATQMHHRVHMAVQQAFTMPPAVILAVPGYLRVDDAEGIRLPPFHVQWSSNEERFRYRAWAAENAKRYLVGCVVIGTIDQVLLSSLMVAHAHLRATSLLRHLLVVDEVHASDAYMTRILEDVLERHRAAGGHAILLSATLGGEARTRLLQPRERAQPMLLEQAENAPYPLVVQRGNEQHTASVSGGDRTRTIRIDVRLWLDDSEALAAEALTAAEQGAKVLVIKNTVKDCITTQMAVERLAEARRRRDVLFGHAGVAAPHHSRFARVDRETLDRALEERIGVTRVEGGCVVVATQTVQQSLDIDADVLFADLCPADVLLQRIGRLHRHHHRPRPTGFETAKVFIAVPPNRDLGILLNDRGVARNYHGLGSVYSDLRMLEATWRLLERHREWHVPAMNRHVVENGLHSSVLDLVVEGRDARWQSHSTQMKGIALAQTRQAHLNLVDWTKPYAETAFPDSLDQRIMTRLGEGDRRVRFERAVRSPFGHSVAELVLPAWWTQGVASDVKSAADVVTIADVTHFVFDTRSFVYDRLGLRPAQAATPEVADDDGP